MENKTKDYDPYCKAMKGLDRAALEATGKKMNRLNNYIQFDKGTNEIMGIFTKETDGKNLNLFNSLCYQRNRLTQKVLSHLKNNGGFLQ